MAKVFHSSVEGAQHGKKGLGGFLQFCKNAGAEGAQPSNFMLEDEKGDFLSAEDIKGRFEVCKLRLDGISAHCPFWVHTSAWTGTPAIKPFIPPDVAKKSPAEIEQWAKDYILRLLDLAAELKMRIIPMFWGMAFGPEVASGYPWGFWKGGDYDLIAEGEERFVKKTRKVQDYAGSNGQVLCHEIHPGTAAICAEDFLRLVKICDGDACLGVNADPSHCWEGEGWETRFRLVGDRVYGCHLKNYHIVPGKPLRSANPRWAKRGMQFTLLDQGDLNLVQYTRLMLQVGYAERYRRFMKTPTAPLVVEAEDDSILLDEVSAKGVRFVNENCCFSPAEGSFEEGMGEQG